MWSLFSGAFYTDGLYQELGGVGSSPATPPPTTQRTQPAATSAAVSNLFEQQQHGNVSAATREEAVHDLFTLSANDHVTGHDLDIVMDLQKRIEEGHSLSAEDLQQLTSVVSRLESGAQGTGSASAQQSTVPPQEREAQQHFQQGETQYNAGNFPAAETEFRSSIAACPPGNTEVLGPLHYNLAQALQHEGKNNEAVQEYNAYLHANPQAEDAEGIRQQIHTLGGEVTPVAPPAEQESQRRFDLGQTLYNGGQYSQAETQFRQALGSCPSGSTGVLADLHHNLGEALQHQGRNEEAVREYNASIHANPHAPNAAESRRQIHALGGEVVPTAPEGQRQAQRSFDTGNSLFAGGDYPGAEREFSKAIAYCPAGETEILSQLHHNLGLTLERQGKNSEAAEQYNAYLQANPNASDADQVREHIRVLQGGAPPAAP